MIRKAAFTFLSLITYHLSLITYHLSLIASPPAHLTLTVTLRLPQGESKVTLKVPVFVLLDETVKRREFPSEAACGSARM